MYNYIKQKSTILIAIISLILSLIFVEYFSFFTECINLNQAVFRLHILANSNSDNDQALKLLVRDKILEIDNTLFTSKDISPQTLELVQEIAQEVLAENNCTLPVNVEVTNMYFTTRFYENFTLPAGNYDALRVSIGDGVGDNWWCVLYPPLCLPAVTTESDIDAIDVILDSEQLDIITNGDKYQFKFAIFEFFSSIAT